MSQQLPGEISDQLVAAIKQGDMIAAIKIYRDYSNCDLAEAKRVCENLLTALNMLDTGAAANTSVTATTSSFTMSVNGVQIPADAAAKVRAALQSGNKPEAIGILHDACNIDLPAAKNAVEAMERMHFQTAPAPASAPVERVSGSIKINPWMLLLIVGFLACAAWWLLSRH